MIEIEIEKLHVELARILEDALDNHLSSIHAGMFRKREMRKDNPPITTRSSTASRLGEFKVSMYVRGQYARTFRVLVLPYHNNKE